MAGNRDETDVEERLRTLESRAEQDRVELARLRAQVAAQTPPPARTAQLSSAQTTAKPEPAGIATYRFIFWVLGFLAGAVLTFMVTVHEWHWHWVFGIPCAVIGGVVVVLLGEAGATI